MSKLLGRLAANIPAGSARKKRTMSKLYLNGQVVELSPKQMDKLEKEIRAVARQAFPEVRRPASYRYF